VVHKRRAGGAVFHADGAIDASRPASARHGTAAVPPP